MTIETPSINTYCLNKDCTKRMECLRFANSLEEATNTDIVSIVNPKYYPDYVNGCKNFAIIKKIEIAWGIKNLFTDLPYQKAKNIKREMIEYFNRTKYYKFFREEIPITQQEQVEIKQIFEKHYVYSQPNYTRYTEKLIIASC